MICRRCAVYIQPAKEMTHEESVKHLLEVHGNRAEKLLLSLLADIPNDADPGECGERYLTMYEALKDHNSEGEYNP